MALKSIFDTPFSAGSLGRAGRSGPTLSRSDLLNEYIGVPDELTPEQESSFTDELIAGTIGAAGAAGNLLDVPASMVRDALSSIGTGEWHNPFDQLASPLHHTGRTTGREILTSLGLPENKETGISGWLEDPLEGVLDVGGFLTEVALDPLTYASFGSVPFFKGLAALRPSGRGVLKSGLLDEAPGVLQRHRKYNPRVKAEIAEQIENLKGKRATIKDSDAQRIVDGEIKNLEDKLTEVPAQGVPVSTAESVARKIDVGFREAKREVTPGMLIDDPVLKAKYGEREVRERLAEGFEIDSGKWREFEDLALNTNKLTSGQKDEVLKALLKAEALETLDDAAAIEAAQLLLKKGPAANKAEAIFDVKKALVPEKYQNVLDESLGESLRMGIPWTEVETFVSPFGGRVSRAMDRYGRWISDTTLGQAVAQGFDYTARGTTGVAQAIARAATSGMDIRTRTLAENFSQLGLRQNELRSAIEGTYGKEGRHLLDVAGGFGRKIGGEGGDIFFRTKTGASQALKTGDFIVDPLTKTPMQATGFTESSAVFRRFDSQSGQYVTTARKLEDLRKLKGLKEPKVVSPDWATDSLEEMLQYFLRASKETDFRVAVENIKIKDLYGTDGIPRGIHDKTYAEVMGFDAAGGGRAGRVHDLIDKMHRFENEIKDRITAKGVDIGDISRTSFHYAPREITNKVQPIVEEEGFWARRYGDESVDTQIRAFGRPKVTVSDPDLLAEYQSAFSETAFMGRDPAVANLPVFVIERMLSDKKLSTDHYGTLVRKYDGNKAAADSELKRHLGTEYRTWIENAVDKNTLPLTKRLKEFEAKLGGKDRYSLPEAQGKELDGLIEVAEKEFKGEVSKLVDNLMGDEISPGFIRTYRDHAGGWSGPMYTRDFMKNQVNYYKQLSEYESLHDASMMEIAKQIVYSHKTGATPLHGEYTVGSLLKKLGHNMETVELADGNFRHIPAKSKEYLEKLLPEEVLKDVRKNNTDILNVAVDRKVYEALNQTKKFTRPGPYRKAFEGLIDRLTASFKGNVTLPFPSFANRNLVSGQFVNVSSGDVRSLADLVMYIRELARVKKIGATIKKRPVDVDEKVYAEAKEFLDEIRSVSLVGNKHFEDVEFVGESAAAFSSRMGRQSSPETVAGMWSREGRELASQETENFLQAYPHFWKSFTEDVGKSASERVSKLSHKFRKGHRFWLTQGSRYNQMVEYLNRAPMYSYLRKKGYSKAEAARRVNELQFDYSRVTDFEKLVMRRVMPFYTFTRKMAPLFFETLLTRPGGALAQGIRAQSSMAGREQLLPEHMTRTAAIPLPDAFAQEEGAMTVAKNLGLAHEAPLGFLGGFPQGIVPGMRQMYMSGLGMTTPIIKGPYELLSGTSGYYTDAMGRGKRLEDLTPPLGQLWRNVKETAFGIEPEPGTHKEALGNRTVETIFQNLPLSRWTHELGKYFDPRKTWLASGVASGLGPSISTVSDFQLRKARADAINRLVGSRGYAKPFATQNVDKDKLVKSMLDAKIRAGTPLEQLPPRFRDMAISIAELKELGKQSRSGRKDSLERRNERLRRYNAAQLGLNI